MSFLCNIFYFQSNEPHTLYELHAKALIANNAQVRETLCQMEKDCVIELQELIIRLGENPQEDDLVELDELFKDCVETEVKFYRQ